MIKEIVKMFFRLLLALAYGSYKIEGVNALLLILPSRLMVPTLRKYGASVGEDVILHSPLMVHNAGNDYSNLSIGSDVYFGRAVFLDLKDKITIADRVTVSMKAVLLTHTDVGESKVKTHIPPSKAPLFIGADAYVGANATISEGVKVGEGAVIGACAFVRRDVAPHTVVAGVPAKEIKKLNA